MKIQVVSVANNAVPGKKYSQIEIAYRNDKGELKGRKVMSFGVKEGLDTLKYAKEGDWLDIKLEKEGQYWNWVGVAKAAPDAPGASKPQGGYNYNQERESREERNVRQRLIVRQSCLGTAVAILKTDKAVADVEKVIDVASRLEAFVFSPVAEASAAASGEAEADVE